MKWLIVLFSIFKPFFSTGAHEEIPTPVAELKEMIKANAAKVLLSFAVTMVMTTLFSAGIVIIAMNISSQYDQRATVQWSSLILSGIILIVVPMIAGGLAIRKYDQTTQVKKREFASTAGATHPLQDALALLIHDFVKEREMKRAQSETSYRESGPHNPPVPTDDLRH